MSTPSLMIPSVRISVLNVTSRNCVQKKRIFGKKKNISIQYNHSVKTDKRK